MISKTNPTITRYLVSAFLITILFILGCTSGKKALERGNYYQSTLQAIERLRKNPDHKKSRIVLQKSYPLAQKYYIDRINNLRQTNDPFKNGKIVDNYQVLNHIYEEIQRCPGAMQVIPNPGRYYDEVLTYSKLAAEECYQAGMQDLRTGTREGAKRAFYNFQQAENYSPNYKDVRKKMDESHEMATLKVIVDQIPVPTVQFQISVDFFQDKVEEYLSNFSSNEFIRFYPANEKIDFQPDQIMVIHFDEFTVGNTNNFQNSKEVRKDSVVVGKVKLDDGTQKDVIGSVKATYTEYGREIISEGLLSMRILNPVNNQVLVSEKFPGRFVWSSYWASFNGDERALSEEQLSRTRAKPLNPPPPQNLFIEFCKPIYDQMTHRIRTYYNQF